MSIHQAGADADHNDQDVVNNAKPHTYQSADAGGLGGPGLLILPDQEEDQAHQGDAAAQKAPANAAVVHGGGGVGIIVRVIIVVVVVVVGGGVRIVVVLGSAAGGAGSRVIVNLCATILTKCHNFLPFFILVWINLQKIVGYLFKN